MGISGLLPFLKDAIEIVHLKQLEGYVVAVDTYCWIYKGAFSCAEQLGLGQPTDGHVKYVIKYVNKLLEFNIKPIMVFDGCCLPSKKLTEAKRRENKEMYRKKAAQCLLDGKRNEARECFQRCLEVTQKMAHDVIKALHDIGVDVIVAPYEADAQLSYLSKTNIAHIIITEDSDLILFGCKKILYKLDLNGNGNLLHKEKIDSITQFDIGDKFERFRWMCILSGCDYLENLPGIGLGKAKKLLRQTRKTEIEAILKVMAQNLKMSNLVVTKDYIENFIKADKTFKYQVVFDPIKRQLVPLNDYGNEIVENENLFYAGTFYDNDLALQLALGNLNVNDKTPVDDFNPQNWKYKPPARFIRNTPTYMRSIWSSNYSPQELVVKLSSNDDEMVLKEINRVNTRGIEKTISSNCLIQMQKGKSNLTSSASLSALATSSPVVTKRKFENDENKLEIKFDNEMQTPVQKKSKLEDIKIDIDNLLGEYTTNLESDEIDGNITESSYFSSSNQMSPVLTKSSQKSVNSQLSISVSESLTISTSKVETTLLSNSQNQANHKTPFRINQTDENKTKKKNEQNISLEEKLNKSKEKDKIIKSPLLVEARSAYFEKLSKEDEEKPKATTARKDISSFFESFAKNATNTKLKSNLLEIDSVTVSSSSQEDCQIESKISIDCVESMNSNKNNTVPKRNENVKKFDNIKLLKDIDNIDTKPATKTNKKSTVNSNSKTLAKPITDYFIKFEYKKVNDIKFINH